MANFFWVFFVLGFVVIETDTNMQAIIDTVITDDKRSNKLEKPNKVDIKQNNIISVFLENFLTLLG